MSLFLSIWPDEYRYVVIASWAMRNLSVVCNLGRKFYCFLDDRLVTNVENLQLKPVDLLEDIALPLTTIYQIEKI